MKTPQLPACEIASLPAVETGEEWQQQHATWVYQGLLAGTILDYGEHTSDPEPHVVTLHEVGQVSLPDGRLGVGDVFLADGGGRPQVLPVGEHTCVVGMGTIAEDHQRVVAGLLLTGTEPIVRWSEGRTDEERDGELEVGDFYGFGIDSGVAAFFAPGESDMIEDLGDEAVTEMYDKFESNGFNGAMMETVSGQQVAVFSTGWGDGHYPTWFGHAADGSVSVVMADFFVFEDPYPDEDEDEDEDQDDAPETPAPAAPGSVDTLPEPLIQRPLATHSLATEALTGGMFSAAQPLSPIQNPTAS